MDSLNRVVSEEPIAVLVDDDASVREALGELLNSVGVDTVAFGSSRELLDADLPDRPGCFVFDVRMPGLSGLDLHRHLAAEGVQTPVVFLTGHGDIAMGVQAMKSGAVDFLTKPFRDQSFLDAVARAIQIDIERRTEASSARSGIERFKALTPREQQVLRLVVTGLLNKQIAFELKISEVTVKLHRSSMMRKMNASSPAQLFSTWQSLPASVREVSPG